MYNILQKKDCMIWTQTKKKEQDIVENKECVPSQHTHRLRNQYVSLLWKFYFLNLAFDDLFMRG